MGRRIHGEQDNLLAPGEPMQAGYCVDPGLPVVEYVERLSVVNVGTYVFRGFYAILGMSYAGYLSTSH